jgi:putative phosphotransacetylase
MSTMRIPMPREQLERIVRQIVRERLTAGPAAAGDYRPNLVVHVSARHMHVCQRDLDAMFGPGSELTVYRWLYQPGEFASDQTVTILSPQNLAIEKVRILGPVRPASQVEISATDAFALGMSVPVRKSGDIAGTAGCTVVGPYGRAELREGLIRAERHVHMAPADAEFYGFSDKQYVRLRVDGERSTVFENLYCRVEARFLLEVHLDTDEGNACDLVNARGAELIG